MIPVVISLCFNSSNSAVVTSMCDLAEGKASFALCDRIFPSTSCASTGPDSAAGQLVLLDSHIHGCAALFEPCSTCLSRLAQLL